MSINSLNEIISISTIPGTNSVQIKPKEAVEIVNTLICSKHTEVKKLANTTEYTLVDGERKLTISLRCENRGFCLITPIEDCDIVESRYLAFEYESSCDKKMSRPMRDASIVVHCMMMFVWLVVLAHMLS
jgi:hypothetical protein